MRREKTRIDEKRKDEKRKDEKRQDEQLLSENDSSGAKFCPKMTSSSCSYS